MFPSSGSIKRASLKLLVMFCVRSRCLAAWNLDLWYVWSTLNNHWGWIPKDPKHVGVL